MSERVSTININVDPTLKEQATAVFKDLGMNMSTAVTLFLRQSVRTNGIPFELSAGKVKTEDEVKDEKMVEIWQDKKLKRKVDRAIRRAETHRGGKVYDNVDEALEALDRYAKS